MLNNDDFYECKKCDFKCSKKSNFERHVSTQKHKMTEIMGSVNQKRAKSANTFQCGFCDKQYKEKSGLWRHKKKCKLYSKNTKIEEDVINIHLINKIISQNSEILKENNELKMIIIESQDKMLEVINSAPKTIINNNIKNIKNKFNLNIFLNETCKNAMNLNDFMNSISLEIMDLKNVGKLGYVNGISNIIVNYLNSIEKNKRPIHCTDKKRQTLYIKNKDIWKKEIDSKPNLRNFIRNISNKNLQLIIEYQKKNPNCLKTYLEDNTNFNNFIYMIVNSGEKEEDEIVKLLSKEILIQRED
jgi:hypothetical protein